jgi:hypothetical protein
LPRMDEPSLGLAPLVVEQLGAVTNDITSRGVSVLLVEQNSIWPWTLLSGVTCCRLARSRWKVKPKLSVPMKSSKKPIWADDPRPVPFGFPTGHVGCPTPYFYPIPLKPVQGLQL